MNLSVLKIDGTDSGKQVVLDDAVFGIEPNDHAIYLDVIQYLAHQRHGNAKSKDRSEVAFSTKKMGRQKGGGGARHGSIKSGIYVGGGMMIHAPYTGTDVQYQSIDSPNYQSQFCGGRRIYAEER